MKLRTTLLAVCMVAVPAVALFSHRVPSGFRAHVRERVAAAVDWCRDAVASRKPSVTATVPVDEPAAVSPAGSPALSHGPDGGSGGSEARLAGLGVRSLECRPLPGANGGQAASCTVALDSDGQLLRVFNATGRDRDAALAALLTEVEGWRSRLAAIPLQPAPAIPSRH